MNLKLNIILAIVIFVKVEGVCQNNYQAHHKDQWEDVATSIKRDWYQSKIDVTRLNWIGKTGIVPPHDFLGIAKEKFTLFYWDNYFTNKGLLLVDSLAIYAKNVTDNLLWEVDSLGFVPNANLSWGMNRSQPPYLAMMVNDVYRHNQDKHWLAKAYQTLKKEYHFWTDTSRYAIENHKTSIQGLQRFYFHSSQEELFKLYNTISERGLLSEHPDSGFNDYKLKIAGNYAAEAATGMDFTPRFEHRCPEFIPVELNSNLYKYEVLLGQFCKILGLKKEPDWAAKAKQRKHLMNQYCWNQNRGMYMDYDYLNHRFSSVASICCMSPLVMGIATKEQASATMKNLPLFEYKFGVAICENSKQTIFYQWDYPAAWPPMYQLTIEALDKYGYKKEALRICTKYLDVVTKNFANPSPSVYEKNKQKSNRTTGKIYEKYNAVSGEINDLEYPAREFMGWSVGVFVWCLNYYNKNITQ